MTTLRATMDVEDLIRVVSAAEVWLARLDPADRQDESIRELEQSIARVLDLMTAFETIYMLGNLPKTPVSMN